MSDAVYLDQADFWSRELTRMVSRGTGDTDNAMRRLEREYELDYGVLWSLRYRRRTLKQISVSAYESIRAAYLKECERQMRKLGNDITKTERITGPDNSVVLQAKAFMDSHNQS